jgi:uncharacterized surface anchored protein
MRRLSLPFLFSALVLLLQACVKPTEPTEPKDSCCNGSLTILVYDSTSSKLITGASIQIRREHSDYQATATTNEAGVAEFAHLCAGTYSIRIAAEGCAVVELSLELECNGRAFLRVPLRCERSDRECCHGAIVLAVRDSATGEAIVGAVVQLRQRGVVLEETRTNGEGVAAFDGLCPGEYVLVVAAEGFQARELTVTLECNQVRRLVVALQQRRQECCNGVLEIVVYGMNKPLPNATVRLWRQGRLYAEARTNQNGVARFANLCMGVYGISVQPPPEFHDLLPQETQVELSCNQARELRIELPPREGGSCCDGVIAVVVRDSLSNSPLQGAVVRLWKGSTLLARMSTNDAGVARFTDLCPGRYGVSVHYSLGDITIGKETEVELECNERVELHFLLRVR